MGWFKRAFKNPVSAAFPTTWQIPGFSPNKEVKQGYAVAGLAGLAGLGMGAFGAGTAGAAGGTAAAGSAGGASMLPGWGAFASGILGSGMNWMSQNQTNQQNLDIAREQMNFQGMMSNTAHQREVADLKAAGLNPVLSAGGNGSSTPSGSQATMQAPQIDLPGIYSMMIQEKQLKQADQRIANETARTTADLVRSEQETMSTKERIKLQKLQQILLQKGMPRAEVEGMIWKLLKGSQKPGKKMIEGMDENHQYQKMDTLP